MKTTYISPKIQIVEARPLTALLSSGGRGFSIPGLPVNYDNGGGELWEGV